MTRDETIHELGEWLEQMIQHGVPSHSAKRRALATAIALLSAEASQNLAKPTKALKGSDLISRADAVEALCHNCAYYTDAQCKTDSGYWCESGAMIREDIPSSEAAQGFRGGKIPPKEMLNGTVLIPKHQWLEMERELAELKQKLESAEAVHKPDYSYEADMVRRIKEALSADAVQGWIPCSERLPEANEVVVLCGKYNMFCGYHNTKGEWYSITGDGWETDMDFPDSNKGDILAWMPLPTPYKGGEDE